MNDQGAEGIHNHIIRTLGDQHPAEPGILIVCFSFSDATHPRTNQQPSVEKERTPAREASFFLLEEIPLEKTIMSEAKSLSTIVSEINRTLRSYGKDAVQEIKMMNRDGQVIGQIRYGYKPQYVFDAINTIMPPENWKHEVMSKEIFNQQAVVEVKLFIRIEGEWLCKGSQIGQMQIVKDNVGDAYKGAITDALQKCFSLLSIGTDAYRGLLESIYKGAPQSRSQARPLVSAESSSATSPEANAPPQPQVQSIPEEPALPQITGVQFRRVDDRLIATGKVYEKKEMLKAAGFKWDGANKNWFKDTAVATH